jgi:hypothetical protein
MSYNIETRARFLDLPDDEQNRLARIAVTLSDADDFMERHDYPTDTELLCMVYEKEYENKPLNDMTGLVPLND